MLLPLRTYIQTISAISEKSWSLLEDTLTTRDVPGGAYLLRAAEFCQTIFFINTGYCRAFHNVDGQEINTRFYFENDFVTNIKSLTTGERSSYVIQACEPLSVVVLDKQKLLEAYKQSQEIETFGRKLLERLITNQEEHSDQFKLLTPQQRYIYLQNHQPELLQRISLTHLSSYLGVSRETLSRIRNRSRK